MAGLHRYHGQGDKYLVVRRDGSVPEWPSFVLGARDPAAAKALVAYADECDRLGMDKQYVIDLHRLASEFDTYREQHGKGDPDASPTRRDNPQVVVAMKHGILEFVSFGQEVYPLDSKPPEPLPRESEVPNRRDAGASGPGTHHS